MDTTTSRRVALKFIAAASPIAFGGRVIAQPNRSIDRRVVSSTPNLYCGWPTLARRNNGELLVVYSGGREQHVCPFGRVEMIRSTDNGETWTYPRTLIDGPIDDRDAGITVTAKGTLLVTTFTSLAYETDELNAAVEQIAAGSGQTVSEKMRRWASVHRRLDAAHRKAELGQWMIRSTDGGVTWSKRYSSIVNSPHGPNQLADGRLLYAGKELWTGERRCGFCVSDDDGQSWRWLAALPTREGDDPANYHELHAVEAGDGKLIAHVRNHNRTNDRETLQSESSDGGETWSTPRSIGVWGLPSHLVRLADDRLLMSYGHRRPPFGVQARVSSDQGETWSDPIVISDDGVGGDLGYPSTVQLSDGTLLTVWYEKMKGSARAVLRQAKWTL